MKLGFIIYVLLAVEKKDHISTLQSLGLFIKSVVKEIIATAFFPLVAAAVCMSS